ncbi:MAG: methionyl-tRNA formyltransferase, partial [Clostridia bacterium]|nr:methionyl-tRNA formyltransferase [Clostridia bacterium]
EIIDLPKYGILNIHASLLPKYRGAEPIQWAIINGDEYTGVTIMKTEVGVDTGDSLISKAIKIGKKETAGELFERLSILGADLIVEALSLIESGNAVFTPQDNSAATHVKMLKKEDGNIDWSLPSRSIDCLVRGMNPWPSAYTYYNGKILKIWAVEICQSETNDKFGQILSSDRKNGIIVSTGDVEIKITELQLEG